MDELQNRLARNFVTTGCVRCGSIVLARESAVSVGAEDGGLDETGIAIDAVTDVEGAPDQLVAEMGQLVEIGRLERPAEGVNLSLLTLVDCPAEPLQRRVALDLLASASANPSARSTREAAW